MKKGDILVAVNGENVKCTCLKDIKAAILKSGQTVSLTVITMMPPTQKPTINIGTQDTMRSSASSSSGDMQQMGDTMNGTVKSKMKNLTFLKTKKSPTLKESLRKK